MCLTMSARRTRAVTAALALALGACAPLLSAQELPPPDVKAKPKPRPKAPEKPAAPAAGAAAGGGAAAAQAPAPPVLLLSPDLACEFAVDGERVAALKAQELRRVNVTPGQHLLSCTAEGGAMRWQKTVEAKAGQQVVEVKMSEVALSSGDDFDRAAAGVWLGLSDLRTAGDYVASVVTRSWGFHDPGLSTALHTANEYLKQKVEDMKRLAPGNPARRKVVDDCTRVAGVAAQYVDLMTKAITEAQKANSWMGSPNDMFSQARALQPGIAFPADAVALLKPSKAFAEALPVERRPELGLPGDPRDFRLGATNYQGTPNVLAAVVKNGLADKLGFRTGDRLVSANGQAVASVWELKLALRAGAGKTLRVLFEREGKEQDRELKVPASLQ
jgi:hypothetical protein